MKKNCFRYIASCVFTRDYPELSLRIQDYLKQRFDMEIIRCCAEKYKVKQFEDVMAPSVITAQLSFRRATLKFVFCRSGNVHSPHYRRAKAVDGRTLPAISDRKGRSLLSLLH